MSKKVSSKKNRPLRFLLGACIFVLLLSSILYTIYLTLFDDEGSNQITIHQLNSKDNTSSNENTTTPKGYGLQIPLLELFNEAREKKLRDEILDILDKDKNDYGVYIKSLDFDFQVGINENEKFYPASTIKVPIAILVMRDIENGVYTLETNLELRQEHKHYTSDIMYYYPVGSYYPIETLLYHMIHTSDNSAWDMLSDNMGTTVKVDNRIKNELELENTHRIPFETTAIDMCTVLENLQNYSYLSEESSEYILELLSDIVASQNDRIPQGVPVDTRVAHKIGSWQDTYQDVGIVYGEDVTYIIVVLNRNTTAGEARNKITAISSLAWEFLNK